jgi:hypothetical protein
MAQLHREADRMRLVLEPGEVEVLVSLAVGLAERLHRAVRDDMDDPVVSRLAPTVSRGDADVDAELRGMLRGDLLSVRAQRLVKFADDIRPPQAPAGSGLDRLLDRDAALSAVEALNDLRLALATTIGFDDHLREELDTDDPRREAVGLMDALAWMQGGLIEFVDADG